MDEITKRQMNRLSNIIIAVCVIALIGIALLKRPATCSCTQVSSAPQTQVVNI
jgi:hypothetical protein